MILYEYNNVQKNEIMKEKFKKFTEGFSDEFSKTKNFIETKQLTKSALILVSAVTLSGCNFLNSEFTNNLNEFVENNPDQIQNISKESLVDIANGKSGIYKDNSGEILFISNYDQNEKLTPAQQAAVEDVIPSRILDLMSERSAYMSGVNDDESFEAKRMKTEANYIHILDGSFSESVGEFGLASKHMKTKDDFNAMTALHELGHFLSKRELRSGHGIYSETLVNEIAADTIGVMLYSVAKDLSQNEFNDLIDDNALFRDVAVVNDRDTSHYTNQGLYTLKLAFEKEPHLFDSLKEMNLEQIKSIGVKLSKELSDQVTQEQRDKMENETFAKVTEDIKSYKNNGELSEELYADSYYHEKGGAYDKYVIAIEKTSEMDEPDLINRAKSISKEFHRTNHLKAAASSIDIGDKEVIELASYIGYISNQNSDLKNKKSQSFQY